MNGSCWPMVDNHDGVLDCSSSKLNPLCPARQWWHIPSGQAISFACFTTWLKFRANLPLLISQGHSPMKHDVVVVLGELKKVLECILIFVNSLRPSCLMVCMNLDPHKNINLTKLYCLKYTPQTKTNRPAYTRPAQRKYCVPYKVCIRRLYSIYPCHLKPSVRVTVAFEVRLQLHEVLSDAQPVATFVCGLCATAKDWSKARN